MQHYLFSTTQMNILKAVIIFLLFAACLTIEANALT